MPAFSSSLGCSNAQYIYKPEQTIYSVPVGSNGDYTIDISGGAYGTVVLAQGAEDAEDIEFEMVLRTPLKEFLDIVLLQYPTLQDINDNGARSRLRLSTPGVGHYCMRFDIVLRVPPALKKLTVQSTSVAQVQFAPEARLALEYLRVNVQATDADADERALAMVLPHANVHADTLSLVAENGWLVGDVALVNEAEVHTQRGAAVANLHVRPLPHTDAESGPAPAVLRTINGAGRTDIVFENDGGVVHRPIHGTHKAPGGGDLYLTYKNAGFNGKLDVKARSYTATGVHDLFNSTETALPWVGDKNGVDMLIVEAPSSWVGLYF